MKIITKPLVTDKVVIEKTFMTQEGYYAVCIFQPMLHRCGYLGLPKGHPLYESENPLYESENWFITKYLQVHQGITFEGAWDFKGVLPNEFYFLGFSCSHIGDKDDTISGIRYGYKIWPKSVGKFNVEGATIKDLSFVIEQLRKLSKQVAPHALMQRQMEIGL